MSDLRETLNHLDTLARDTLERLERAGKATGAGSTSSIVVQAGGVGVWISATFAAVAVLAVLLAAIVGSAAYLDMRAEIRALKDTDNAIRAYINTGILKPASDDREQED